MTELLRQSLDYFLSIDITEALGLIFGLLCVYFLIKENVFTWPTGITYILLSLYIFWTQQLYGDFILHIFFLILNIYGWYYWVYGKKDTEEKVVVRWLSLRWNVVYLFLSLIGVLAFGLFLSNIHVLFPNLIPASVPYWDAATTSLSVTAMWLTARKKVENWIYWFAVDILAAGIYFYKGIYFYSLLYFVYIGLAVAGYLEWKKLAKQKIS
ncbi:nicotinamide riboside transporter PnuC [Fulvivirga lutea]|uniref:Nicotinamide riboside transporter PnuC n=1 Tax=Fulvivirga lutea TaxID=2810512 RepID=A0A974WJJ2_9BACT|nr:nicotinamide riboside transporter PnuC [Fulvivirga lutea]QSE98377.1 nicotinamide mononucleotide transporter [Fulvivirga lutea]